MESISQSRDLSWKEQRDLTPENNMNIIIYVIYIPHPHNDFS